MNVSRGIAARRAAGALLVGETKESESPRKTDLAGVRSDFPSNNDLGATPTPIDPRKWGLWFPARVNPRVPQRTKNGKPKRRLPTLPPNVNERRSMHWRVENTLVGYWRLLAKTMAESAGIPPMQRVSITATVKRRAMGVADESGDAERLKPLVDGLTDAGVIPNDTRAQVEYGPVREMRAGADGPGIVLWVREIAPLEA